jgi:ankyrin repeat protein
MTLDPKQVQLNNALLYHSANGEHYIVDLLIKNGAYLYANNDPSLEIAVKNNHIGVVKNLLINNASNSKILEIAVDNKNLDIVKTIIQFSDKNDLLAEIKLVANKVAKINNLDLFQILIKQNVVPFDLSDLEEIIITAVSHGSLEIVKYLAGIIDIRFNDDILLYTACKKGQNDIVAYLLGRGSKLANPENALLYSVYKNNFEMICMLLWYHSNFNLELAVKNAETEYPHLVEKIKTIWQLFDEIFDIQKNNFLKSSTRKSVLNRIDRELSNNRFGLHVMFPE